MFIDLSTRIKKKYFLALKIKILFWKYDRNNTENCFLKRVFYSHFSAEEKAKAEKATKGCIGVLWLNGSASTLSTIRPLRGYIRSFFFLENPVHASRIFISQTSYIPTDIIWGGRRILLGGRGKHVAWIQLLFSSFGLKLGNEPRRAIACCPG